MPGISATFSRDLLEYYEVHFSLKSLQNRTATYGEYSSHYIRFIGEHFLNREPLEVQRSHLLHLDCYSRRICMAHTLGMSASDAGAVLSHPEYFKANGRKKGLYFDLQHALDVAPFLECDPFVLIDRLERMYKLHPFEPDILDEFDFNTQPTQDEPFQSGFVCLDGGVLAIVSVETPSGVKGVQQLSAISKQHAPMSYGSWFQYLMNLSQKIFPKTERNDYVCTVSYPLLMQPAYRLYRITRPLMTESCRIRLYSHLFTNRCLVAIVQESHYETPLMQRERIIQHIARLFFSPIPSATSPRSD